MDPPVRGSFHNGVGTFYADDTENGKPIRIRFDSYGPRSQPLHVTGSRRIRLMLGKRGKPIGYRTSNVSDSWLSEILADRNLTIARKGKTMTQHVSGDRRSSATSGK